MSIKSFVLAVALGIAFLSAPILADAAEPAVKCESGKLKIASKYSACRLKADAKGVSKGVAADYTKCESKFPAQWNKAEGKALVAGGTCPSEGDAVSMDARITADADEVAALIAGGAEPACGDGTLNVVGEHCDGADLDGYSCGSLGFGSGALSCDGSCDFDASACMDCTGVGGAVAGGACWFLGAANANCNATCSSVGLIYDDATATYAGSEGSLANCEDALDALGIIGPGPSDIDCTPLGIGCAQGQGTRLRCATPMTNATDASVAAVRACACK